ncbi:signal peptidase I [Arthrobacter sp. JSM 101049]|uniref:signal peptidase I n=1 Tax=Arthrobacter sp. JSM 101049 TaxID=929097 RepID=UPI003563CCFC
MSRARPRIAGAGTIVAALVCTLVAVLLASHQIAFVSTYGVSMNPVYYQGDLVVVSRADAYSPGDIVAYHLTGSDRVVLHRIIASDTNGFTFKGDNNESIDVDHPKAPQLIGKAWFHIPHGGDFLRGITSPPMLGLIALALLAGATPTLTRRRRRRAARREQMSSHVAVQKARRIQRGMIEGPRAAWTGSTAALAILAIALGTWAWTGPAGDAAAAPENQEMTFSYSAEVPRTAAYDGTSVVSPDPVFRRVTDTVEVHYSYSGPAATIAPVAELSAPGGWHTTVPLGDSTTVQSGLHQGSVELDIAALQTRADRAAKVTGLQATPLTVEVVPVVTGPGVDFRPALKLSVTALQVSLVDPAALTVAPSDASGIPAERTLSVGAWHLTAEAARVVAPLLLAVALAALALVAAAVYRQPASGSAEAIRHRWPSLVVPVHPIPMPPGRPVIDVVDFPTLAKLAERYGLLVLHWSRSDVETFIVQDHSTTYRYRSGEAPAPAYAVEQQESTTSEMR